MLHAITRRFSYLSKLVLIYLLKYDVCCLLLINNLTLYSLYSYKITMKKKLNRNFRFQSKSNETSQAFQITVPFQISESKWREIFEEEYNSFTINCILNDIITLTMDTIYNVYLEKTVYSFVVHCSHLAWLQLFDTIDLPYDLGETSASIKKYWTGDRELKPSPIDPLCCKNVEIRRKSKNCSSSEYCSKLVD